MSALKTRKRGNGGVLLPQNDEEMKVGKDRSQNMTVAVRIRPLSQREIEAGHAPCCSVVHGNIVAIRKGGNASMYLKSQQGSLNEYGFDAAFDSNSSQLDIYEKTAKPYIPTLMEGYNVTVFAYGATGAGKTHTMMGSSRGDDTRNTTDAGIIPNSLSDVFALISSNEAHSLPGESWSVVVSFMEVYNEQVFDLLEPTGKVLSVREDQERGVVVVAGLTQQHVTSSEHVLQLLVNGNKNRKTESTMANQVSSRSHAILQLAIKHRYPLPNGQENVVESVLSLIDLAGSERASATNNTGTRLQEGANINKSLLALANCINALASSNSLSQGSKRQNVKYRDSKLTHLLKSSLEGHCHVIMIANINPSHHTFEDSHNTLKYANRAKNIKINPTATIDTQMISSASLTQAEIAQWMEREANLREENNDLRLKIAELNEIIDDLKELQKKKSTKCCICGLNNPTFEKIQDENISSNPVLASPLPSKSPLRPNSSPLASKKSYSPGFGKSIQNSIEISSPDHYSQLEGEYNFPSFEQITEALEDPLCLSEDLLFDNKSSNGGHKLKNRIAELSVITQQQQEMFQNLLQDTEKIRRESVGIRKRRSSIVTSNSSRIQNDEQLVEDISPQTVNSTRVLRPRRASISIGNQIYHETLGIEETKELEQETMDDALQNPKKRRYSLIPGTSKNSRKSNILQDKSNISIFNDPHNGESEKKSKKPKVVPENKLTIGESDIGNENIAPKETRSSRLRRNSITSSKIRNRIM